VVLATAQPLLSPADDGVVADPGLGHEHLVEQRPAGHLPQRPDLHARLAHVEGEVGDALVLRHVRIGAGQQHAHVGDLPAGSPHLLPGHDPFVAVALGPGLQAGQVRAGARLAEELAPRLGAGDDGPDVAFPLLVGAVGGDGRAGQQQPQPAGAPRAPNSAMASWTRTTSDLDNPLP
jgi:hypothetical protein